MLPILWPLLLAGAQDPAVAELAYRIARVAEPELRVDVHLRATGDEDGVTELGVQERWGGVDDGGRDVSELVARGAGGRALEIERLAPHRWSVRHAPGEALEVVYSLPRNDHQAHTDPGTHRRPIVNDAIVSALGRLFLVLPEHLDREEPRAISIEWSGFGEDAGMACSFGAGAGPLVFEASLERLAHSVFLAGDVRILPRELEGGTIWLVVDERGFRFDVEGFADLLAAIVETERAFFADLDHPFFLVTLIPVGEARPGSMSFGGTGLTDSFALAVQPGPSLEPGSDGYRRIAKLLAHEMFHDWNGTLLQPDQPEELCYWFSEGFTDFYARRILLRAGLTTVDESVASLNEALRTLFTSPVRAEPNERIRADYWNDPDVQRLPYSRGDAVAMVLDHAIRQASDGERSLDDLVRELMERARGGWKVSTARLLDDVARQASPEVAESIRAVVEEGALPRLDPDTFAPCLSLETVELFVFDLGFDLEGSMAAGEVRGVRPDGPAHAAGMRDGRALRGWSVRRGDTENPVSFRVVVDGEERSIEFLPRGAPVLVPQFVRNAGVEDAACHL